MQNRIVRIVMLFVSCFLLVVSIFSLVEDGIYFITRTETTGQIVSINDLGVGEPYKVSVRYFNRYLAGEVICYTHVKTSNIKERDRKTVQMYYARYMPCVIYLEGFNAPRYGVFLIDVVMIILMSLAVSAFKPPYKVTGVSNDKN